MLIMSINAHINVLPSPHPLGLKWGFDAKFSPHYGAFDISERCPTIWGISLGPDHKGLVPRNTLAWLWPNKNVVTNQIRERLNCPIRFNVSYSINFTRLELISVLSRFPLLVSGILLFIVTLKQCLEQCIHRRSISIHSDYIIRDVIFYAAKWLHCVAPDPCGLGRD